MYHKNFPDKPERTYEKVPVTGPSCKFTDGVRCPINGRQCYRCGHNPEVAQKRLCTFCKAHGITVPDQL